MKALSKRLSASALVACAVAAGCSGSHPGLGDDTGSGLGSGDDASPSGDDDAGQGAVFGGDAGSTGPTLADAGCATATAEAKRRPVYLMFVLDGSDSMRTQNKWTAVGGALESIFTQMQASADPGVGAGLLVFPNANGTYPGPDDVPIGFVNAAQKTALSKRLGAALMLGTPTQGGLSGGYGELETFTATAPLAAGGKKVLVLITDGIPTDACSTLLGLGNIASNACVVLAADKLKEAAPRGPIETFVLGVGQFPSTNTGDFDPTFLGNVAKAGGTGKAGCNPNEASSLGDLCYFEVDPSKSTAAQLQKSFETSLNAIRGQVSSCSFPITESGLGAFDPTLVNVDVGGKTVVQDAANGWTYDDPRTPTEIDLHGSACATATGNLSAKVSIVIGCATQTAK